MKNRNFPPSEGVEMSPNEAIRQILKQLGTDEKGFLTLRRGEPTGSPLGLRSGDAVIENNTSAMDLFRILISELSRLANQDTLAVQLLVEAKAVENDGKKAAIVVKELRELYQ